MKVEKYGKSWFTAVFNQNYEPILNYLFYISGDRQLSEDLVQEVFLQLWENRSTVKENTLRPYLFTIARNCFLKNKRRQKYAAIPHENN